MYLDLIKKIMPPPEHPAAGGSEEMFDEICGKLKLNLPEDYRRFIMAYGEGEICNEWCIYSPFSNGDYFKYFNLLEEVRIMGEAYLYLKKHDEELSGCSSEEEYIASCYSYFSSLGEIALVRKYSGNGYPFKFYPEADGLFPFGRSYSGYEFYWKTSQNKDWSIIVYPDTSSFLEYNMSTTEFIYKVLINRISCDGLSEIAENGMSFQQFKR